MKKILIATDFSVAARNASDYGVRLAEAFNAKVVLASAYQQVPIPVTDVPVVAEPEDMEALVGRQLQSEVDPFREEASVAIEPLVCEGGTVAALLRAAKEAEADLIVVGMTGSGKSLRKFFGSTTTGLARKTTIPMLVIPEGVAFTAPRGIALASDVVHETDFAIPAMVQHMAARFHAKMYIIRLFNREAGEVIEILHQSANLHRTIGSFTPLYEIPANESLAETLNEYISLSPIDVLAIRPHARSLPERWFLRSNTREMIFQTETPLLILPGDPHKTHAL